jgi:hypothetical protein
MATAGGSRCPVRADRGPSNLQRQSLSAIGTGTFWPPPTATCPATLAATSAATLGKALPQGKDAGGKGPGSYINARKALSAFRELDATHTSVSTVNARSAVWSSPAGYLTSRLWRAGSRGRPVARCSPGRHQRLRAQHLTACGSAKDAATAMGLQSSSSRRPTGQACDRFICRATLPPQGSPRQA